MGGAWIATMVMFLSVFKAPDECRGRVDEIGRRPHTTCAPPRPKGRSGNTRNAGRRGRDFADLLAGLDADGLERPDGFAHGREFFIAGLLFALRLLEAV